MKSIGELCRIYTNLTKQDIRVIQKMAIMLQPLANLEEADVFIDCPIDDNDSIVVAEAKPAGVPSSYKNSVVGMLAKQENEPAVSRTMRLGVPTKHMKALTQESTHVIQSVEPIRNEDRIIGVLIREQRLEEQYVNSERLHLSEPKFENIADALFKLSDSNHSLLDCFDEGVIVVDHDGIIALCNKVACDLYREMGFVDDVLGKSYAGLSLMEVPKDLEEKQHFEETKVGQLHLNVRYVYLDQTKYKFAVIIRDITLWRKQEREIILKSVAIKEMHHRVKNNLQTIASLLSLQIRRADNEETKGMLGESMNRILSMASTHELLAQSGVDKVNIMKVITNIKENSLRYFDEALFNVQVDILGDDFQVDSDIATSIALIINELMQNSLKYAFVERKEGSIKIVIKKGSLYSHICMTDNGRGFDCDSIDEGRLGLRIVKVLVRDKLHGTLEISSDEHGTSTSFDFLNQIIKLSGMT